MAVVESDAWGPIVCVIVPIGLTVDIALPVFVRVWLEIPDCVAVVETDAVMDTDRLGVDVDELLTDDVAM